MKSNLFYFKITIILLSLLFIGCRKVDCPECKAKGKITKQFDVQETYEDPVEYIVKTDCSRCKGRGRRFCTYQFSNAGFLSITDYQCDRGRYRVMDGGGMNTGQLAGQRCGMCKGSGYINCKSCKGYGYRQTKKTKYETKTRTIKKDSLIPHDKCEGTGKITKFL